MKHVVTGAPEPWRVLATGFGAFPGARSNPTIAILRQLERSKPRLARLGISLETAQIPVVYAEIDAALAEVVATHRPDAVLHLGLAGRRRRISIETRALNRAGPLHPDASGHHPASQILAPRELQIVRATYPTAPIAAALRRAQIPARLSIDAGDYVCNATLYRSLATRAAPQVGFLHVPRVRKPGQPNSRVRSPRPAVSDLTDAVLATILVMARQRYALRALVE